MAHIPPAYWYALFFVLGTIVGSFLNVVLYRLHTGRSLAGRSHCTTCGKTLSWYELIPLFSYLLQCMRCFGCGAKISSRYFTVELVTGVLFLLIYYLFRNEYVELFLYLVLVSLFVLIAFYDIRHTIIPDELTGGVACIAVLLALNQSMNIESADPLLYGVLAGTIASSFFFGLWYFSHGRWLGLGDAKLAFPLGLMVGLSGVFSVVVLSFWIGAVISLAVMAYPYAADCVRRIFRTCATDQRESSLSRFPNAGVATLWRCFTTPNEDQGESSLSRFPSAGVAKYRRYFTMKSEVPFAPFLILGFLIVHLLHADIFDITYTLLYP